MLAKSIRWWILFIILSALDGLNCAPRLRKSLQYIGNNCSANFKIVENLVCDFKNVRNKIGMVNFGATLKQPVAKVTITMQTFEQTSDKSFKPGHVNLKIDACDQAMQKDSVVFTMFPMFKKIFVELLKPCSYTGRIGIANLSLEYFDDTLMRKMVKTGNYKVYLNIIDATTDLSIMAADYKFYFKGPLQFNS